MQEPSIPLAESISNAPGQLPGDDRTLSPMHYLLVPISEVLRDRVRMTFSGDAKWQWFDFYPAPDCFSDRHMSSSSLFDSASTGRKERSLDGIVVNLQLGWLDFDQVFRHCLQLLKPGGHLYFSTFGPDTLFQLREAWQQSDSFPHIHDFADLHVLGDQLIRGGFEKPILDTDWMGVEFEDIDLVMSDLRSQGFGNLHQERRRGLTAKGSLISLRKQFENQNPVQMTFEVVYGYAKKPQEKSESILVSVPSVPSVPGVA